MKTQQRNTKHTPFAAWDFALRVPESAGILSDFQGRKKKGLQPVLPVQPVQLSLRLHPREILLAQSLYNRIATEFERFSDLKFGFIGIRTVSFGCCTRISSGIPALSFPNIR